MGSVPNSPVNPYVAAEDYPSIQRVIVGLCMLGDTMSVQYALILGGLSGWIPAVEDQPKIFGPMPWQLSAVGDVDGDGFCNAVEWSAAKKSLIDQNLPATTADVFPLWQTVLDPSKGDLQPLTHTLTRTYGGMAIQPYAVPQQYLAGEEATVYAIPTEPWLFDHWEITPSLSGADLDNPVLPVVMDMDRSIRAVFTANDNEAFVCRDPRLMQAIRVAIGKLDQSETIYHADVKNLTALDANNLGVESLDGISQLTALTRLSLFGNKISDITPLSSLTNLRWLLLGGNRIGAGQSGLTNPIAPLHGLAQLEFLDLGWGFTAFGKRLAEAPPSENAVRDLGPLASLNALRGLDLSGNRVTWLDALADKETLQFLLLDKNPIWFPWYGQPDSDPRTCFSPIGTLDSLLVLSLQGTGLGQRKPDMPAVFGNGTGNLPLLQQLVLSENPDLASLEGISGCVSLETLLCVNNATLANLDALYDALHAEANEAAAPMTSLQNVVFESTAIANLRPFLPERDSSGQITAPSTFNGGLLTLRNNSVLLTTQASTLCDDVQAIEHADPSHPTAKVNTVDRDFTCAGERVLTLDVSPSLEGASAGSIDPFVGNRPFLATAMVPIRAIQTNPNYIFSHWLGDVADPTNPDTVVYMGSHRHVTAVFVEGGEFALTLLPAEATLPGSNQNIPISATLLPGVGTWACQPGEIRQIEVTPAPGWGFLHWIDENGAVFSTKASLSVRILGKLTLKPILVPADTVLDVQGQSGAGTISPSLGLQYFRAGQEVNLRADAEAPYVFEAWTVQPTPVNQTGFDALSPDTTLIMDRDYALWATFSVPTGIPLTVSVQGFGHTEPVAGTRYFAINAQTPSVTQRLTATPYGDWCFVDWLESGKPPVFSNPYDLIIDAALSERNITALFQPPFCVDDFQVWLNELGPLQNSGNGIPAVGQYQLPSTANTPRELVNGHDMPDLVRLGMLQIGLTTGDALMHDEARAAYAANLQQWHVYLNECVAAGATANQPFVLPSFEQIRTYAAYCTLSGAMQSLALAHFLATHSVPDGVTPPGAFVSVAALAANGDADGDGFANIDEWLYANWSYQFPLSGLTALEPTDGDMLIRFMQGLQLGLGIGWPSLQQFLPNFDASVIPNLPAGTVLPPTTTLNISITPAGASGTTSPPPGRYELPTCSLSALWAPMADPQTPAPGTWINYSVNANPVPTSVEVIIRAMNSCDWTFRGWECGLVRGGVVEPTTSSPSHILAMALPADTNAAYAKAKFANQPAISTYSKVEALRRFLVWRAYLDASDDVYQCSFDRGGSQSLDNPDAFAGNGIPDVAEFALLDAILFDAYPGDTLSDNPGIIQTYAARAFRKNRELALKELSGSLAAPDWLADVVAGYMTLGGLGYQAMIRREVMAGLGRELIPLEQEYDASQYRFLGARKDADGDGVSNRKEWDHVADDVNIASTVKVDAFVDWALRADDDHTPDTPPVTIIDDPNDLPKCWNDSLNTHWPAARVSRATNKDNNEDDSLNFTVRVKLDPDDDGVEIDPAYLYDIPIPAGRIIELEVSEADVIANGFYRWDIPGTAADGSNERKVQFTWAPPGEYPEGGTPPAPTSLDVYAEPWPRSCSIVCNDNDTTIITKPDCHSSDSQATPSPMTMTISGPHHELGYSETGGDVQGFGKTYSRIPYGCTVTVGNVSSWSGSGILSFTATKSGTRTLKNWQIQDSAFRFVTKMSYPVVPNAYSGIEGTGYATLSEFEGVTGLGWHAISIHENTVYPNATCRCGCYRNIKFLPSQYSINVAPHLGYYVFGWDDGSEVAAPNDDGCVSLQVDSPDSPPVPTVKECSTLDVDVIVRGGSGEKADGDPPSGTEDTSAAAGWYDASPDGHFFKGEFASGTPDGTVVQLTAKTRNGYTFEGWSGQGTIYTRATGSSTNWVVDAASAKTFEPNTTIAEKTIYVKMGESKHFEAVFVESLTTLTQDSRDILAHDDPDTPFDDNVATISTTPAMPNLIATYCGTGTTVNWQLVIRYVGGDPTDDEVFVGVDAQNQPQPITLPSSTPWNIGQVFQSRNLFCGGNATLTMDDGCGHREELNFRIFGMNPTRATVRGDSHIPDLWRQVVAYQESYTQQFRPDPDVLNPWAEGPFTVLRSNDNGFGIMQLTNTPLPGNLQLWNWRENLNQGNAKLDQCRQEAQTYWNEVANGLCFHHMQGEEIPNQCKAFSADATPPATGCCAGGAWNHTPDSGFSAFTERQTYLEIWSRYRSGFRYHNWIYGGNQYTPGHWARRETIADQNGCTYAEKLMGFYDDVQQGTLPPGWN